MNPTTAESPSLQDGYNGASDASILEYWAAVPASVTPKTVNVQCTAKTKSLLHRAGFQRCRTHNFYAVPVCRDRFERLQLAPAKVALAA
ncbi:hypothetical protein [Prosthecobacter sp.]|uniref:hypothetical protein n=1 Tax=Prosthecobacter sp. TaxID=1965333 RepID=UPI003783130E